MRTFFDCRKKLFKNWYRKKYWYGASCSKYSFQLFDNKHRHITDNIITIWGDGTYCINKNEDYPIPETEAEFKEQLEKMGLSKMFF